MATDLSVVMQYIYPLIGSLVYGILGLGMCFGIWYWLFVLKQRRTWLVDIWERKSDGRLHLVNRDKLSEKKINKGKQVIYIILVLILLYFCYFICNKVYFIFAI